MTDMVQGSNLQVLVYNIFFEDSINNQRRYLLTISVLPTPDHPTPSLSESPVPTRRVKRRKISYEAFRKLVIGSAEGVIVQPETYFTDRLRTDHLIPVFYDEDAGQFATYENKVVSECFIVDENLKSAPFNAIDLSSRNYQYLLDTVVTYYKPATINLKAPVIPQSLSNQLNYEIEQKIAEADGRPVPDSAYISSMQNYFRDLILTEKRMADSVYHLYYKPSVIFHSDSGYPIGDFYYHPRVGVVGGSYESYFKEFYNWIPEVVAKKKVMYTAKEIQP